MEIWKVYYYFLKLNPSSSIPQPEGGGFLEKNIWIDPTSFPQHNKIIFHSRFLFIESIQILSKLYNLLPQKSILSSNLSSKNSTNSTYSLEKL